jgi:hypothetical protein
MADELRRSQVITTFGVGSIVDLKYCSAVIKSPDIWPIHLKNELEARYRIDDLRLSQLLNTSYFVQPPTKYDKGMYVPMALFPRMLYCPACKSLMDVKYWFKSGMPKPWNLVCDCKSKNGKTLKTRLIPSRFIAICPKGHMDDFPYYEWVHNYNDCPKINEIDYIPSFEYYAIGGGASLDDIKIKCKNCNRTRSLRGALTSSYHEKLRCTGNRPEHYNKRPLPESCGVNGSHLHFVLRNASNVYFPRLYSSLLIPPFSQELCEKIQRTTEFHALIKLFVEKAAIFEQSKDYYVEAWAAKYRIAKDIILKAVEALLTAHSDIETIDQFKGQEFEAFLESEYRKDPNFKVQEMELDSLSTFKIQKLFKCSRLREIRVLAGYSRVRPAEAEFNSGEEAEELTDPEQMRILYKSVAPLTQNEWLPGIEVFGEGILLVFDNEALAQFEEFSHTKKRISILRRNLRIFIEESGFKLPTINSRFVAIHTLCHALIKRISFECGYGLASLRERIYCNLIDDGSLMNGMLIYTADTDSEGTLGGLSRLAKAETITKLIENAMADIEWCSSDPVCRECNGQGIGSLNLAACHSCCLLPETCCEYGNRFLDRGLMEICFLSNDQKPL